MATIILAGGTGLIGTRLRELFIQKGHTVRTLTRSPKGAGQYAWDPYKNQIDTSVFDQADAVVNLAGSGIADQRWTNARKKDLVDSRVKSIETLHHAMAALATPPKVFVSASAIGIYGNTGENWQYEDTIIPQHSDQFMVTCCAQWETAARRIEQDGTRTVILRVGVVLSKEGGALKEIAKSIPFGVAAYFSDGQAWYSWIHIDDICNMFIWAVEQDHIQAYSTVWHLCPCAI